MNAQKQKGQALNAASAQKAIDILKVHCIIFFMQYNKIVSMSNTESILYIQPTLCDIVVVKNESLFYIQATLGYTTFF